MLKKKLGIEGIERDWCYNRTSNYYKIPSSLTIPEGCRKINFCVFWACKELKEVEIPESVKVIGNSAFEDCIKLEKVVIPKSVVRIENWAFSSCRELKKIEIPGSVEYIGDEAFWGCKNAEITIKKPESRRYSKRYISPTAFKICKDVKEETGN